MLQIVAHAVAHPYSYFDSKYLLTQHKKKMFNVDLFLDVFYNIKTVKIWCPLINSEHKYYQVIKQKINEIDSLA